MDMEGYSVAKRKDRATIYRNEVPVATISKSIFSGRWGFDWHKADMWKFHASDFIKVETKA